MIKSFLLGVREFRLSATLSTSHPRAYDAGRELAHRVTLRKWDA